MNLKTTVILIAFLALGVAAVMLTRGTGDKPNPDTGQTNATDDQPILDADQLGPSLSRITFDFGTGGPRLILERRAGRWWVKAPHEFPADRQAIDSLLTLLGDLQGTPTEDHSGLIPDGPGITLSYPDSEIWLSFNKRIGAGREPITVSSGGAVNHYNAKAVLNDLFERLDPSAFFARSIDAPLMAQVGRIEITSDGATSQLVQQDGRWRIEDGRSTERALEQPIGEFPGVATYFKLFDAAEIMGHQVYTKEQGLRAFGLDKPLIRVRFVPAHNGPSDPSEIRTLSIGVPADPADQTRFVSYGRANDPQPAVFTVATPYALAFGQSATAFRDPRIVNTPPTLIESIKVTDQELVQPDPQLSPAVLKPQDRFGISTFTIRFTTDGKAELSTPSDTSTENQWTGFPPERGAAMLHALTSALALAFVDEGVQELKPIKSVRITARLGRPMEHFTIYQDPESGEDKPTVLICRAQETVALRIERAAVQALLDPARLLDNE